MTSMARIACIALLSFLALACSSTESLSVRPPPVDSVTDGISEDLGLSDDDAVLPSVAVHPHPSNSLAMLVSVSTASPTNVSLTFSSADSRERVVTSGTASNDHEFEIVGLRAETEYQLAAQILGGSSSELITFTTGVLPAGAPTTQIVQPLVGDLDSDGITFFVAPGATSDGPKYFGIDAAGFVVWYLEDDGSTVNQDPFIRSLDGEILVLLDDSIERMTLSGDITDTRDLSNVALWHHDAILLPSGNTLALGRSVQDVDGVDVQGDVIVELDITGSVVWEWSTFDHLDISRYPGPLSLRTGLASGAIDWTHANSLYYDEATNQILMSLRSQNWIVAIDHETSEISWIAGESVDTAPEFANKTLQLETGTWMSGQHSATLTAAGELLVYDNRNGTGGETNKSRVVVYDVDHEARTAAQTFEFVLPKYTASLGDVDELPNGNLLITAGGPGSNNTAHLIEVTRDGETVWEATTPGRIYRSERMAWSEIDRVTDADIAAAVAETPSGADRVDITDLELVSTDASCDTYVGRYSSTVTDVQTGMDFEGELEIFADGIECTLTSNQIPNHDMGIDANFANEAGEVASTWVIPNDPQVNNEPTDLGFTVHAVMLNGVIWEAYPAACYGEGPSNLGREAIGCGGNQLDNPWRYNVGSALNSFQLDAYSAHVQAGGLYHYHSTPEVLHGIGCTGLAPSPLIGFARDGFPIFGPCFTDVDGVIRAAQSSFELNEGTRQDVDGFKTPTVIGNVVSEEYNGQFIGDFSFVDGAGDLDECNGMTIDGQYGYYITGQYPYVLSCFSGTPSTNFGASANASRP